MVKVNVAVAGGPCTGKTTLAAHLYAHLKLNGYDYDLVQDVGRRLKKEFGRFTSPFERFYFWRQQEREELRSTAENGFITDKPLFHYFIQARQFASGTRDMLAVRELYKMCLELDDRYHLIIIAKNPNEIKYKKDNCRIGGEETAKHRHSLTISFVEYSCPEKILFVEGDLERRTERALKKIEKMHSR